MLKVFPSREKNPPIVRYGQGKESLVSVLDAFFYLRLVSDQSNQ